MSVTISLQRLESSNVSVLARNRPKKNAQISCRRPRPAASLPKISSKPVVMALYAKANEEKRKAPATVPAMQRLRNTKRTPLCPARITKENRQREGRRQQDVTMAHHALRFVSSLHC